MASDLSQVVVLITSKDKNNESFGTGFIIYQNDGNTFVATCSHVVKKVVVDEEVLVDGNSAKVLYADAEEGFDLSILKLDTQLSICKLLPLGSR